MTASTDPRTLPARPPSEVEWEDLLVRLEIMPRALRVAIEDAPADAPALSRALRDGVRAEAALQAMLESMVEGREYQEDADRDAAEMPGDAQALLAEYGRLRTRSFVMVQRRGLNVWDWQVRGGPFSGATAYQLFQAAAQTDGALLAAVRAAGREGAAA
jgi:hypothetical protein